MVKGGDNNSATEPMKTRKQSASERRNSVSDIKDFFQAKTKDTQTKSPMTSRKASGKTAKEKEKERNKELRETRENIKTMIKNIGKEDSNANGDVDNHDKEQTSASKQLEQNAVITPHSAIASDVGDDTDQTTSVSFNSTATQTSEDEVLSAISELVQKYKKLEDAVEDPKNGLTVQLAKTKDTVSTLYSDINGAVSGLKVQMAKVTTMAQQNTEAIEKLAGSQRQLTGLLDDNKKLVQELRIMQGLIQKASQQSIHNSNHLLDLTKRGMEQNLLFHGIDDSLEREDAAANTPRFTYKERCKETIIQFLKEALGVNIDHTDVWKAHRTGAHRVNKVRPIVVKLAYSAKDLILENVYKLKDQANPVTNQKYFIGEQVPEGLSEKKKQLSSRIKTLRDLNDKKPKAERSNIQMVNDTILIDEKVDSPEITTPQPSQLFLDIKTQEAVDSVQSELVETEPETARNSEFVGLAAKADSIDKVRKLYTAVVQRYPSAEHAIMAYALKDQNNQLKTGFCDDREFGAGHRLKRLLFEHKCRNTVVFVLRKYGGVHLGFNRFTIIEQVAKNAIAQLG